MNEIPFAVNFQRFKDYLLAPDEIVMFEWFLFKQYYFSPNGFFHYSKPKIEEETKISRRRQEAIVKKFEDIGFLKCVTAYEGKKGSYIRHFKVNYDELAKDSILAQIIDEESKLYVDMKKYVKNIRPF